MTKIHFTPEFNDSSQSYDSVLSYMSCVKRKPVFVFFAYAKNKRRGTGQTERCFHFFTS